MNWIGQHIWSFISRFRSDVYLEDLDTSTETNILVVDSAGKITKNAGAGDDMTFTLADGVGGSTSITDGNTLSVLGGTDLVSTITTSDTVTVTHDSVSRSDTTSTASPAHGATFTCYDGVTTSARGHIEAANLKTVTLPADNNTNQLTTFRLEADVAVGAAQTLAHNNTLTIAGGDGINTTTAATDTVNVIIDTSQTTITDIYNHDLEIGYASDEHMSMSFSPYGVGIGQIQFLDDGVVKYTMETTGIYPLNNVSDLGTTSLRWKNIWLSELCTAVGLVAETSLTLDSVVLTTVQTESEVVSGFANNDTSIMTGAAANERFRRAYFEVEGYSVGDGNEFKIPATDLPNKQLRAPEHTQKAGTDGLLAINPGILLRTAGIYMPYSGRLISWKGWETSSGSGSSYVSLFKYTPTADDATADSLVSLRANSFTAAGNNNLLALSEDVAGIAFAAGDIVISGIKGVNNAKIHFYSMLEVEFD